jgi:tRNA A-37 threonylcarbamoyl transferase component Bud32
VLRRYRRRDVPEYEVNVIRHVRAHGFPTPAVLDVSGPDLVLERVDGPTMRVALEHDPSTLRRHAATLARLHEQLGRIVAPEGLRPIGLGDSVVHCDLHPENVLMGREGPMVIDWANARRGHWADDVAMTVVIVGGVVRRAGLITVSDELLAGIPAFVDAFLEPFDRDVVRAHLAVAIERRASDPNLSAEEIAAARRVTV